MQHPRENAIEVLANLGSLQQRANADAALSAKYALKGKLDLNISLQADLDISFSKCSD